MTTSSYRRTPSDPSRAPRSRNGFTLIEVAVALVIAATVAAAAHAAVSFASDASERRSVASQPALHGSAARRMMEGWFRSAWLGAGPFLATDHRSGDLQLDEVWFGVADAGALRPGAARIHLWVDADPATPRTGVLAEVVSGTGPYAGMADTLEIAPGAHGLALRYRVRLASRESWVDVWESGSQLPEAVELRLLGGNGMPEIREAPLLALPFTVRVGWSGE